MTFEERVEANKLIDKMIGSREQQREITSNMTLENRIRSNSEYQKMREKLMKNCYLLILCNILINLKCMINLSAIEFIKML